jgi:hypothetical protein
MTVNIYLAQVGIAWDNGKPIWTSTGEPLSMPIEEFTEAFLLRLAGDLMGLKGKVPEMTFWERIRGKTPAELDLDKDVHSLCRGALEETLNALKLRTIKGNLV